MIFTRKSPQCPRCRSVRVHPETKGQLASWGWGYEEDLFRWECGNCRYKWKEDSLLENEE